MTRAATNFLLDCWLLISLLTVLATAGIVQFVFPAGTQAQGWTLWGLSYDAWCKTHTFCLALLTLSILLHLILHWNWICGFAASRLTSTRDADITRRAATDTLYGVGTLIIVLTVLGALVTAAEFSIQAPAELTAS